MDITSSESRELLFVPSIKCQSLLGKALQEHFRKPEEIASVFSSSPSLRNSSVGANFLTNFKLDEKTAKLFDTVFTAEDCFSVQLSPSICICDLNFIQNFISKTKNLEASLRSLKIESSFITDEQLHFTLSHLKRITKFELVVLDDECQLSSAGVSNSVGDYLNDLQELKIQASAAINTSTLEVFASKLTKLETFFLEFCSNVDDDGIFAISKMESLTSLKILNCQDITSAGFGHIASMVNLRELGVEFASPFSDENLRQICTNCPLIRRLSVSRCDVSNEGLAKLNSLQSLEALSLNYLRISDQTIIEHVCCLKSLSELDISSNKVTDVAVEKICLNLGGLTKLNVSFCHSLTNDCLEHLTKLVHLRELGARGIDFSLPASHSFLKATKSNLKTFHCSGLCSSLVQILAEPPPKKLTWAIGWMIDSDVSFLLTCWATSSV
jgi:hypothetical protein